MSYCPVSVPPLVTLPAAAWSTCSTPGSRTPSSRLPFGVAHRAKDVATAGSAGIWLRAEQTKRQSLSRRSRRHADRRRGWAWGGRWPGRLGRCGWLWCGRQGWRRRHRVGDQRNVARQHHLGGGGRRRPLGGNAGCLAQLAGRDRCGLGAQRFTCGHKAGKSHVQPKQHDQYNDHKTKSISLTHRTHDTIAESNWQIEGSICIFPAGML